MTCYLTSAPGVRDIARVERFGEPAAAVEEQLSIRRREPRALVRVTHASVGITDVMAHRGDYLLQPRAGFVPGYDFVGTILHAPAGAAGFGEGQRVIGVLPRMGAHTSHLLVPASLLVPIPDALDSLVAATVPLDAATASFALDARAPTARSVLVQGAGGAVGAWAAQLASARGLHTFGTAASRSAPHAERFTHHVLDYRKPGWIDLLIELSGGGVDAAVDHTGNRELRRAVRPSGRIIRIGFGGEPGTQRAATVAGSIAAIRRRFSRPAERILSLPLLVATQRRGYRRTVSEIFRAVASGELVPPHPRPVHFGDYDAALDAAAQSRPGEKTVLVLP